MGLKPALLTAVRGPFGMTALVRLSDGVACDEVLVPRPAGIIGGGGIDSAEEALLKGMIGSCLLVADKSKRYNANEG